MEMHAAHRDFRRRP